MKLRCSDPRPARPAGFSLLQMLGVLAIMAVLAGTLLPFLIRSIDRIVSDQEIANLNNFDAALQQSIMRNGFVPSYVGFDWAVTLAAELGIQATTVENNVRGQPRYYMVDPAIQIGST